MRYAGFWSRLTAGLVDFLIFLPLVAVFIWAESSSRSAALLIELPWALTWAAYNIFFHARWGQSIGKMVLRIRVVALSGDSLSWTRALLEFDSAPSLPELSVFGYSIRSDRR